MLVRRERKTEGGRRVITEGISLLTYNVCASSVARSLSFFWNISRTVRLKAQS